MSEIVVGILGFVCIIWGNGSIRISVSHWQFMGFKISDISIFQTGHYGIHQRNIHFLPNTRNISGIYRRQNTDYQI